MPTVRALLSLALLSSVVAVVARAHNTTSNNSTCAPTANNATITNCWPGNSTCRNTTLTNCTSWGDCHNYTITNCTQPPAPEPPFWPGNSTCHNTTLTNCTSWGDCHNYTITNCTQPPAPEPPFSPPRPVLPTNMFIRRGAVDCFGDDHGPPCVGLARGVLSAYYSFADSGEFLAYREDTVFDQLPNASSLFGLRYAQEFVSSATGVASEVFLLQHASAVACLALPAQWNISRFFLRDFAYAGVEQFAARPAYAFNGTLMLNGATVAMRAFVDCASEQVLGWEFLSVRYTFFAVEALDAFAPDTFHVPDNVNCTTPPMPPNRTAHADHDEHHADTETIGMRHKSQRRRHRPRVDASPSAYATVVRPSIWRRARDMRAQV